MIIPFNWQKVLIVLVHMVELSNLKKNDYKVAIKVWSKCCTILALLQAAMERIFKPSKLGDGD